jgi:hypothetical protein
VLPSAPALASDAVDDDEGAEDEDDDDRVDEPVRDVAVVLEAVVPEDVLPEAVVPDDVVPEVADRLLDGPVVERDPVDAGVPDAPGPPFDEHPVRTTATVVAHTPTVRTPIVALPGRDTPAR